MSLALDPLSPEIKKFSSKVTKEKKSTSLNCRSKGAPKPQIQFYKDGSPIRNGENGYKIDYKRLVIPNPEFPDHDGIYTCSVSNMFGKATGDAKLAVTGMDMCYFTVPNRKGGGGGRREATTGGFLYKKGFL